MNRKEWILISFCSAILVFLVAFYFYNFFSFSAGLSHFKQGNYKEAKKEFLNVLSQEPFLYPARLNLGLIHSLMKDFKSALGEYKVVFEESSRSEERFQAYFNSAYLKTLKGDQKEEALYDYQQALKENPNSIEAKTNIELLMKHSQESQPNKSQKDQKQNQKQDSQTAKDPEDSSQGSSKTEEQSQEENINKKDGSLESSEGLSAEQMKWILEELENRERKLRTKLQESQKGRRGKAW